MLRARVKHGCVQLHAHEKNKTFECAHKVDIKPRNRRLISSINIGLRKSERLQVTMLLNQRIAQEPQVTGLLHMPKTVYSEFK